MTARQLVEAEKLYNPNVVEDNGKLRLAAFVCKEEDGSFTIYPGEGRIRGLSEQEVENYVAKTGFSRSAEPEREEEPER